MNTMTTQDKNNKLLHPKFAKGWGWTGKAGRSSAESTFQCWRRQGGRKEKLLNEQQKDYREGTIHAGTRILKS